MGKSDIMLPHNNLPLGFCELMVYRNVTSLCWILAVAGKVISEEEGTFPL